MSGFDSSWRTGDAGAIAARQMGDLGYRRRRSASPRSRAGAHVRRRGGEYASFLAFGGKLSKSASGSSGIDLASFFFAYITSPASRRLIPSARSSAVLAQIPMRRRASVSLRREVAIDAGLMPAARLAGTFRPCTPFLAREKRRELSFEDDTPGRHDLVRPAHGVDVLGHRMCSKNAQA